MSQQTEALIKIRNELLKYQIVACELRHEKVLQVEATQYGGHTDYPNFNFSLYGLCPKAFRNRTLNCAHSISAVSYDQLIRQLSDKGMLELKSAETLSTELKALLLKIYLLDHEKGRLEKELAFFKLHSKYNSVKTIEKALKETLKTHHAVVEDLENFHHCLVQKVNHLIEDSL